MKPKILLFDIETMANEGYVWGIWEQNVIAIKRPWYMLSFAYKWLGDKKTQAYSLPDFKLFKRNRRDDKALCKELWKLFNKADVVMAHNGFSFDVKKAQARFIKHRFKPTSPFQQIDTLKVAKKYFKFDSNKLDELGKYLGVGQKIVHTGFDLWLGCAVRNEKKSWNNMVAYNKQDVILLEAVYERMKPYMTDHPNHNVFDNTKNKCPTCGGIRVIKDGKRPTRTTMQQRMRCMDCGANSTKPITKKDNSIIR